MEEEEELEEDASSSSEHEEERLLTEKEGSSNKRKISRPVKLTKRYSEYLSTDGSFHGWSSKYQSQHPELVDLTTPHIQNRGPVTPPEQKSCTGGILRTLLNSPELIDRELASIQPQQTPAVITKIQGSSKLFVDGPCGGTVQRRLPELQIIPVAKIYGPGSDCPDVLSSSQVENILRDVKVGRPKACVEYFDKTPQFPPFVSLGAPIRFSTEKFDYLRFDQDHLLQQANDLCPILDVTFNREGFPINLLNSLRHAPISSAFVYTCQHSIMSDIYINLKLVNSQNVFEAFDYCCFELNQLLDDRRHKIIGIHQLKTSIAMLDNFMSLPLFQDAMQRFKEANSNNPPSVTTLQNKKLSLDHTTGAHLIFLLRPKCISKFRVMIRNCSMCSTNVGIHKPL